MTTYQLPIRLKRLRATNTVRAAIRETHIHVEQLIAPLFIHATASQKQAIMTMPGHFQWSLSDILEEIKELWDCGIRAVLLFGIPETKDDTGSHSLCDNGIIQKAIRKIKQAYPALLVIADVCLCEYTTHGHCGVLDSPLDTSPETTDSNNAKINPQIDNDQTLAILTQQAISYAKAGADWIAPSSMTDGMVQAIRTGLDSAGYSHVAILSYAVKYSSNFYGPFREAAQGSPQFGDRKTYQMDYANAHEALREAKLDYLEGADLLMVKPAGFYLDIIYRVKQCFPNSPLCAYQVSGEYAMLKHAANAGILNEQAAIEESLIAIKRAGADLIITYFAKQYAKYLL